MVKRDTAILNCSNEGALIITNTILVVPYYDFSIVGTKTLV